MNFAYRNNNFIQPINPTRNWTNEVNKKCCDNQDDRFGGFLFPFLAGAVVSAPLWYIGANNKAQQQMYYQQQYYNNQPYPMYYPQQTSNGTPYYFPYPPYR